MGETQTWYKVERSSIKVTPVQVVRETEAFVVVLVPRWGSQAAVEQRCKKTSEWDSYYPTEAEAAAVVIQGQLARLAAARKMRHEAESRLGELRKAYPEAYKAATHPSTPAPGTTGGKP